MSSSRRDLVPLAPGFTFCPPPNQLTDLYLRRKITGEPLPEATARFIHDVDVYSAEPEQLAKALDTAPGTGKGEGAHGQPEWYFFSPVHYVGGRKKSARGGKGRRSRTIGGVVGKHWHSEARPKPVVGGSAFGGYEQKFSYMVKDKESGQDVRAGWIMAEYGISEEHGGGDFVLCNIHRAPRAGQDQAASATTDAVHVPDDPPISSKKRKAAAEVEDEDTRAIARPRHTVDKQDQQHPLLVESVDDIDLFQETDWFALLAERDGIVVTEPPCAAAAQPGENAASLMQTVTADHTVDPDQIPLFLESLCTELLDDMTDNSTTFDDDNFDLEAVLEEVYPGGFDFDFDDMTGNLAQVQEMDGAAPAPPPSSDFFHNVEQEFGSLYQNNVMLGHGGDLAALAPPAAQPLEEDAGLVQSITADRDDEDHRTMEGTQPEPEEHVIYGLPCPDFSPEMIRRCCMMPWPLSPTSMAAIVSGL